MATPSDAPAYLLQLCVLLVERRRLDLPIVSQSDQPSLAHRPRWSEDFAGNGLGLRYAVDSVSKGRGIAVGESERRGANIGTDHAHGIELYRIERRTGGAE